MVVYSKGSINYKEFILLFNLDIAYYYFDKTYLYIIRLIINILTSTILVFRDQRKAISLGILYNIPINIRSMTIFINTIIIKNLLFLIILGIL